MRIGQFGVQNQPESVVVFHFFVADFYCPAVKQQNIALTPLNFLPTTLHLLSLLNEIATEQRIENRIDVLGNVLNQHGAAFP